jgi:hypothetical protein
MVLAAPDPLLTPPPSSFNGVEVTELSTHKQHTLNPPEDPSLVLLCPNSIPE